MKKTLFSLSLLMSAITFAVEPGDVVITYCKCVDNSGPDLTLTVENVSQNQVLVNKVLSGWQDSEENWRQCREAMKTCAQVDIRD